MPIYFYWGEDSFRLQKAVEALRLKVLDSVWGEFNFDRYRGDALFAAMGTAAMAPMGGGHRLVWLEDARIFSHCPEAEFAELARTLPLVGEATHLLLTLASKPDGRLKSTKLVLKTAQVLEFSLIPPWQEGKLKAQVQQMADERRLKLSATALQLLTEAVGNDTRRLDGELEKLALYAGGNGGSVDTQAVMDLVSGSAHTSFQLAAALLAGQGGTALQIIGELLRRNEPALRIGAVLTGQFRTWLWVRLLVESGERDSQAIAAAAEIGNPNRIYFLQKEVERTSAARLAQALPALLEMEVQLKSGAPERPVLEAAALRIAAACR